MEDSSDNSTSSSTTTSPATATLGVQAAGLGQGSRSSGRPQSYQSLVLRALNKQREAKIRSSSKVAITRVICSFDEVDIFPDARTRRFVGKALKQLLTKGQIVRVTGVGETGSFKLPPVQRERRLAATLKPAKTKTKTAPVKSASAMKSEKTLGEKNPKEMKITALTKNATAPSAAKKPTARNIVSTAARKRPASEVKSLKKTASDTLSESPSTNAKKMKARKTSKPPPRPATGSAKVAKSDATTAAKAKKPTETKTTSKLPKSSPQPRSKKVVPKRR